MIDNLKAKLKRKIFIKYDNSELQLCSLSNICSNTFQRKHYADHYQEDKLKLKSNVKTQNLCLEQSKSYFQTNVQMDIHDVLLYFNDIPASFLYKDLRLSHALHTDNSDFTISYLSNFNDVYQLRRQV